MTEPQERPPKVGDSIDDLCRVCKDVRTHAVLTVDDDGEVERVMCQTCQSQHNYRYGGLSPSWVSLQKPREPRIHLRRPGEGGSAGSGGPDAAPRPSRAVTRTALPLVSERERIGPPMSLTTPEGEPVDLEMLLRRIIREETGLTPVPPADRWRGGQLVLRPGKEGVQEKVVPIESFFHKVVMLRNRLRVLEQQINSMEIPADAKVKLQGYITACYGSLTTFNVLFANKSDNFVGQKGDD